MDFVLNIFKVNKKVPLRRRLISFCCVLLNFERSNLISAYVKDVFNMEIDISFITVNDGDFRLGFKHYIQYYFINSEHIDDNSIEVVHCPFLGINRVSQQIVGS